MHIRASVSHAGYQGMSILEEAVVSPSIAASDVGRSRGPFLLFFAAVCIILAGYMAYTSGLHLRASNTRFIRTVPGNKPVEESD